MTDRYPDGKVIGGLAGGGQESGENRLLLNGEVFDGGWSGCDSPDRSPFGPSLRKAVVWSANGLS